MHSWNFIIYWHKLRKWMMKHTTLFFVCIQSSFTWEHTCIFIFIFYWWTYSFHICLHRITSDKQQIILKMFNVMSAFSSSQCAYFRTPYHSKVTDLVTLATLSNWPCNLNCTCQTYSHLISETSTLINYF
jgi:hypothetical protein